jgi:ATP-binding protein involved in chromosome partitioning
VPILGVVENMSFYQCPECGHRSHVFSHGGGAEAAQANNVPFLGEVPLTETLRESSDAGTPIVVAHPDTPEAQAIATIARKLAAQISIRNSRAIPLAVR